MYDNYYPYTDNFGGDRNVEIFEQNPIWMMYYLDSLQFIYDYDVK